MILADAQRTEWLASAAAATELLMPAPHEMLERWPVSRRVNRAGNENDPKLMPEEALILKRNPDARYTESYNVLFEGRHVGRIYKAVSHAPREAPWFWGLDFFEWQGSDGPEYVGLVP